MAVKKEELIGYLTEKQKKTVEKLQRKIDKKIRKHYVEVSQMTIIFSRWPNERVREELKRVYKENGFDLSFSDSVSGFWNWNCDLTIGSAQNQ